jgi:hypothetical protein
MRYQTKQAKLKESTQYDYTNQAWVIDGKYVSCGHLGTTSCACFGTLHAGQLVLDGAKVH